LDGQRKKVEMGGERGTYGAHERCIQGFGGQREKDNLGDPGVMGLY